MNGVFVCCIVALHRQKCLGAGWPGVYAVGYGSTAMTGCDASHKRASYTITGTHSVMSPT